MSATSLAAQTIASMPATDAPISFNGNTTLFGLNLFLMTAGAFLGVMMAGKQARRIWVQRSIDHPLHPVSLYRTMLMLAGLALALRCGAEAVHLWSWSTHDASRIAIAVMAKRWLDPIALACGMGWMAIAILGEPGIEEQLRKMPLPADLWSRWPALKKPALVVLYSLAMATAAVVLG